MSLFEDKKYEEMDWLAKAAEPLVSSVNDLLSELPDKFDLDNKDLANLISSQRYSSSIDCDNVVNFMITCNQKHIPNNKREAIYSCFTLVQEGELIYEGGSSPVVTGNGKITLIKRKMMFEERELLANLGQDGIRLLRNVNHDERNVDRINEVLDLFEGSVELRLSRSVRKKVDGLVNMVTDIMAENKWNIRNIDLADRIVGWLALYIDEGNLPALVNFCKFKVMTHDGSPIYSVQEEEV